MFVRLTIRRPYFGHGHHVGRTDVGSGGAYIAFWKVDVVLHVSAMKAGTDTSIHRSAISFDALVVPHLREGASARFDLVFTYSIHTVVAVSAAILQKMAAVAFALLGGVEPETRVSTAAALPQ